MIASGTDALKLTPRFSKVDAVIKELSEKGFKIQVTGHSKGSAFARAAIEENPNLIEQAVLFNEPKQLFFPEEPPHISKKITRYEGQYDPIGRSSPPLTSKVLTGTGLLHEIPPKGTKLKRNK